MPTKTSPAPKQSNIAVKNTPAAAKAVTNGNGTNGHAANGTNGHGGLDKKKLLTALEAFKTGDFNAKLEEDFIGIDGRIASVFNEVLELNRRLVRELDKVNRVVG